MSDVKVYSTPTCPWCKKAKEYLNSKNIEFEDVDVSKNQEAAREMIEKSGQMGVPQIQVGEEIIVGFDPNAIEKAMENA